MHHNFRKGDLVRLATGTSAIKVTRVGGDSIIGFYLSDLHQRPTPWRKAADFVRYHPPKQETPMLYTLKSDPSIFGAPLATNGAGLTVFEVHGTGNLLLVQPDDVIEVLPYTILLGSTHYQTKPGLVAVGDYLTKLGQVMAVDTKCREASPIPPGTRRILTESLDL